VGDVYNAGGEGGAGRGWCTKEEKGTKKKKKPRECEIESDHREERVRRVGGIVGWRRDEGTII